MLDSVRGSTSPGRMPIGQNIGSGRARPSRCSAARLSASSRMSRRSNRQTSILRPMSSIDSRHVLGLHRPGHKKRLIHERGAAADDRRRLSGCVRLLLLSRSPAAGAVLCCSLNRCNSACCTLLGTESGEIGLRGDVETGSSAGIGLMD